VSHFHIKITVVVVMFQLCARMILLSIQLVCDFARCHAGLCQDWLKVHITGSIQYHWDTATELLSVLLCKTELCYLMC